MGGRLVNGTGLVFPGSATRFQLFLIRWGLLSSFGVSFLLFEEAEQPLQKPHHQKDDDENDLLHIRSSEDGEVWEAHFRA